MNDSDKNFVVKFLALESAGGILLVSTAVLARYKTSLRPITQRDVIRISLRRRVTMRHRLYHEFVYWFTGIRGNRCQLNFRRASGYNVGIPGFWSSGLFHSVRQPAWQKALAAMRAAQSAAIF